jgi:hypothetical protein
MDMIESGIVDSMSGHGHHEKRLHLGAFCLGNKKDPEGSFG